MKAIEKLRSNMAFNVIGAIVLLLVLFGLIVSTVGYVSFTNAFKKEYSTSTYHMADTAASLVNGSDVNRYLEGERMQDYLRTKRLLDEYCYKMNVSLVYVIKVDGSDYGRFVSIFNSVNNSVDNSSYKEWELGHERDTTNDEYRRKYKAIYDKEAAYETVYRTNPTDGSHPHITTMVPVKDSVGEVVSILCVQRPIRELNDARRPYLITIAVSTVLLSFIAGAVAAAFIKRQLVAPIRRISAEAQRFASENKKGAPLVNMSKLSEIVDLADSIDTMESDMLDYIDNLTAATAERERIGTELSLAGTIQENSIPNDFPAFPERKEFDIFASMTPAKMVGGDFYNFFLIDEDRLAIIIGDVSGKGIPASLFMMVTNIIAANRARMGGAPGEILNFVNNEICEHNKAEMFVTIWLGILDIRTGKITAANAGHDDAAILKANGEVELKKTKHGLVVGAMPDIGYKDFEIQLEKGDKLFLYTDGVTEATNANNELFGMSRMIETLEGCVSGSPEEVLAGIAAGVNEFVGEAPQFDDLTMLCLEYRGTAEE